MANLPQLHLISSVYLSPKALSEQNYDTSKLLLESDRFSRVGRFFTGLLSFRHIPWETVSIFFELDSVWRHLEPSIIEGVNKIFPQAKVVNKRFTNPKDWISAAQKLQKNSIIYLHCNDDHALVSSPATFVYEAQRLHDNHSAVITMVTHFPEVKGMLYRQKPLHDLRGRDNIKVGYAQGTTLVKTDFYRQWWSKRNIAADEFIVRPDNPFGKSIIFEKATALVPRSELVRHMDGYAHVATQRPLAPIRNLVEWKPSSPDSIQTGVQFESVLWPGLLLGVSGKGADLHSTYALGKFWPDVLVGVARLNAQWALRIHMGDLHNARFHPDGLRSKTFFLSLIISSLRPQNMLNALDTILDPLFLIISGVFSRFWEPFSIILRDVYYLGSRRSLSALIRRIHRNKESE